MNRIRFSIIIPTRNRHETLKYTIDTILIQNFENYELIVFDNNSSSETKDVVLSFNTSKINYYRSEKSLAMADSWESAISFAHGEYVIITGDDDGILPGSLSYLNKVINETQFKAIRWERIYYNWPSIIPERFANYLSIPAKKNHCIIDSNKAIVEIANFKTGYTLLPMLYNSAIHIDLIKELKSFTGRVFNATSPDIYSGYAFAYLSKKYLSLGIPLSINGGSSKSNGTATMFQKQDNKISRDFNNLYSSNSEIKFHENFPFFVRSFPLFIAEPFQQLKDKLFPDNKKIALNFKSLMINTINNLIVFDEVELNGSLDLISKALESNKKLKKWYRIYIKTKKINITETNLASTFKAELNSTGLSLNAKDFNCFNNYDVANLCSKFYSLNADTEFSVESEQISKFISRNNIFVFTKKFIGRIQKLANYLMKLLIIKEIKKKLWFKSDYNKFLYFSKDTNKRFELNWNERLPILDEKNLVTGFDRHYIYHTAWAARILKNINPIFHVDISSSLYFSCIVSAFNPVKFYDFNVPNLELKNLEVGKLDLNQLPFENESVLSLSCMHVVEHIGLGRYGDILDYDGDLKAMHELCRVLAVGGNLLFVVPIGNSPVIKFNAHRIYTKDQIIEQFTKLGLELIEFTLIPEDESDGGLVPDPSLELLGKQEYACGCFWFKKVKAESTNTILHMN
jgi:glycosyltransferase involved in cell wall biosynthesis